MSEKNSEYQFLPCPCGKTLRFKVSDQDQEVKIKCRNCMKVHEIILGEVSSTREELAKRFEEIKPYINKFGRRITEIVDSSKDNDPEVARLMKLIDDKGFDIDYQVQVSISPRPIENKEKEKDGLFLKSMGIRP